MNKVREAALRVAKAIVAVVTPIVVMLFLKAGVDVDSDAVSTVIAAIVTSLVVYMVPNKEGNTNE